MYDFLMLTMKSIIRKSYGPGLTKEDKEEEDGESHEAGDVGDVNSGVRVLTATDRATTFIHPHPQHNTHRLSLRKTPCIPDFIGGQLPRRDKGDTEFYSKTMLTLFKPWRHGTDLRGAETSWKRAFDSNKFADLHEQKMQYFHVLYECQDARDDYRAQRKKGLAESKTLNLGVIPMLNDKEARELDAEHDSSAFLDDLIAPNLPELLQGGFSITGKAGHSRLKSMQSALESLQRSGWLSGPKVTPDAQGPFLSGAGTDANTWSAKLHPR